MIASKGDSQMHKRRGKSNGWAAFDQQQRQKLIGDGRVGDDPFPSLSGTMALSEKPERVSGNKQLPAKPFSSVVVPSVDFIAPTHGNKKNKQSEVGNSDAHWRNNTSDSSFDTIFGQLKKEYSWADDSLIEDIMASVDNDLNAASSFLKAMISDNIIRDHGGNLPEKNGIYVHSVQTASEPLQGFRFKLYMAATRHSKAATNSFLRGDHYPAQQFSLKAQEEWESANRLNEMAALEILRIRNESSGIWRLDLHGLHASEAVQALQEHLHIVETQLYFKDSNSPSQPDGSRTKVEVLHASSSSGANKMHKPSDRGLYRPNLKWLEVITGIGNHSRGGTSLPTAVKTFLVDNGCRIDEARPGVIMVGPKLHSS